MVAVSTITMTTDVVIEVGTTPVKLLDANSAAIFRKIIPEGRFTIWISKDRDDPDERNGEAISSRFPYTERVVGTQSAIFQGEVWGTHGRTGSPVAVVVQEGE
jgi:hypothetical protein